MRIVYTLVLSFTVILNSVELSSHFEFLPNGDPVPNAPRGGPSHSSSERPHSPERSLAPVEPSLPHRTRSPPARCIAPPTRLPSSDGNGYGLEGLEFIRLISKANPHRLFELRRYTFPAIKLFKIGSGYNEFLSIPNQEQIVLSTFDGNVYAILESSDFLAGLYGGSGRRRMKINMESGKVTRLTRQEIAEVPVGARRLIKRNFRVERVECNPPYHTFN